MIQNLCNVVVTSTSARGDNLSNCKDKLMSAVFHASVMLLTMVCYASL